MIHKPFGSAARKILSFGLLILLGAATPALAKPHFFYLFDESPDPTSALDASGEGINFSYSGSSGQSDSDAKFGKGSMIVGEEPTTGFGGSILKEPFTQLNEPVEKMTITLWLKLNPGALNTQVTLLQRLNSSIGNQGYFGFSYSPAAGKLTFALDTEDGSENGKFSLSSSKRVPSPSTDWLHLAVTFDHGKIQFFVDGEPLGEAQTLEGITSIPKTTRDSTTVFRAIVSSPGVSHVDDFGYFGDIPLPEADMRTIFTDGLENFVQQKRH